MNRILLFAAITLSAAAATESLPSTVIKWEDLSRKIQVLGALGLPLGEVARIEGVIVAGHETNTKALSSEYLIRVHKVNGQAKSDLPMMQFRIPEHVHVPLAESSVALSKLKHGVRSDSLTDAQIQELEKDYVGKNVVLSGYEVGAFSGVPRNIPKDVGVWQGREFGFSTHLILLKDLSNSRD